MIAEHKRELAKMNVEHESKMSNMKAKAARVVHAAEGAMDEPRAAPIQAKLEAWFSRRPA